MDFVSNSFDNKLLDYIKEEIEISASVDYKSTYRFKNQGRGKFISIQLQKFVIE